MFMFHSAEEKGLLGSKYMAKNLDNLDRMIAHVNLDMIGREATDSIYSIGSDRISKEFGALVEEVNEQGVGMYLDRLFDAPDDPQRLYYRSDHYNFAKENIPVVFFFDDHKEDYHRVTDDAEKINYHKISNIVQLVHDITLETANRDERFEMNDAIEK